MASGAKNKEWQVGVVVITLCLQVVRGAYDRTICDRDVFRQMATAKPGPVKPLLAGQYSVRVEANLLEDNRTLDVHEFYDFNNNRGALLQWDRGVESRVVFDGHTDQVFTVTLPDTNDPHDDFTQCEVRRMSSLNNSFVFGATKYTNGTEHIFNIGDTFRMAVSQPDVYLGSTLTEGGVWVEGWMSCLYMDTLDATFNATWYFTANNTWTTSLGYGAPQSPVSLRITGRVGGAMSHDFDHVYSFSEYRPQFEDQTWASLAFQTPTGVYCPGRDNTVLLPNMTDNFSFKSEVVDTATQFVTFMAEYYNYEMRVVRYEYQALQGSVYGTNPLTRIHDFNTGVAYTIDRVRGNCSATPIKQLGFDDESRDSAFVVMRTSQQFFDMQNGSYVYTGQRTVRDIECDVWITVRTDWPSKNPFQTNWEWYFASRSWMESVGYQYEVQLPVMLRISAEGFDPPFVRLFNVYDYREGQNQPWDFDISACFPPQQRKEYTFTIPGNYSRWVSPDESNFRYFFIMAVTAHAQVSFTRVANVQFDHDDNNIYASFSLLDVPPVKGDVNTSSLAPQLSLQQASVNMETDLRAGDFNVEIQMDQGQTLQKLVVSSFTLNSNGPGFRTPTPPPPQQHTQGAREDLARAEGVARADGVERARRGVAVSKEDGHPQVVLGSGQWRPGTEDLQLDVKAPAASAPATSYSSGAMAGLGFAMLVLGYAVSFVLTLLAYRKYAARHRMEPDSPMQELKHNERY